MFSSKLKKLRSYHSLRSLEVKAVSLYGSERWSPQPVSETTAVISENDRTRFGKRPHSFFKTTAVVFCRYCAGEFAGAKNFRKFAVKTETFALGSAKHCPWQWRGRFRQKEFLNEEKRRTELCLVE